MDWRHRLRVSLTCPLDFIEAAVVKASLLVIQGVDIGTEYELGSEEAGIGRGIRNGVRILDTEVSRQHAQIRCEEGQFVLIDRGSSNGTFVNGVPIRRHVLSSGDRIQCGRTVIQFTQPESDDGSKYVAQRVDLLAEDSPEDRSEIVGSVSEQDARESTDETGPASGVEPRRTVTNLQALYRISEEAVTPSIPLEQLLRRILDVTVEVVGADRGCILVRHPETDEVVPQAYSDRRDDQSNTRMPVSRSIVNYVLQQANGVRTSDAQHDQRFEPGQSILQAGIREAMCVPIQGRRELLGVIYVDTTTPLGRKMADASGGQTFSDDQLRLLAAIGRQTAQAVENNRYQQALVKAERLAAMGQTIAMLSHHIKNILQGVRGGSYLIDMGLGDHDEDLVRKGWGIVERNQSRIYNLVMDMLTFSKERQPVMEPADLNETVSEVCDLMQARAEECGLKLRFEPGENLVSTTFDKEGIYRAVLNIVSNAIEATDGQEDGEVVILTEYDPDEDMLAVKVTDNGPGIPADQLPKIFNLFESTKGARGTGLGLAVSQKIIREHGGRIDVESVENEGCRFVLAWPRYEEEQRAVESRTQQ